MIPELQTLYYYEIDHAHLDFDSDPTYQENMARALTINWREYDYAKEVKW